MDESTTDRELLARYAGEGSAEAFAEIVRRHAGPVHATCLRLLGEGHAADDAAQGAFIALSRKARVLPRGTVLAGWLHDAARKAAFEWRRREARRKRHEDKAARMRAMETNSEAARAQWESVGPRLDEALASLSAAQRDAVLLRHVHGRTEAEAAAELGWSRSRVSVTLSRAMEALRRRLARRGADVPAVALGTLLAGNGGGGAAGAPATLVASIQSICLGKAAAPAAALEIGEGVMRAMWWTKAKLAAAIAGCALLLAGAATVTALGASGPEARTDGRLAPPPFKYEFWDGWYVEHVAFTLGQSGRPVGGPARWAVGGCLPQAAVPVDQEGRTYTGAKDSDLHIFFSDQHRRFWILAKGEVWPIIGHDDLGDLDGPGLYAKFKYSGVYGGGHSGMKAVGYTLYVTDNGCLRRIKRADDGTWSVETVAGLGASREIPAGGAKLADLGTLGKGLALDPAGNLYFTMGGGLVKADPAGNATWVITRDKAMKDMADVYAKKWPGVEPAHFGLGQGEGVGLVWNKNGSIYGGGRTWPSAWRVTPEGVFMPQANYAPKDKMKKERWGPGDPGCYEPHCAMGFGVCEDGVVWMENELPSTRVRYEENEVKVLANDYTWKSLPWGSKDALDYRNTNGMSVNGESTEALGNAPGRAYSGRTVYLRARREK